jgi:hypothetical protein
VDVRLSLGDDVHPKVRQGIHDPADGDFVPWDDLRGKDDAVALRELQVMVPGRDPPERGARLALPARRDDKDLAPG